MIRDALDMMRRLLRVKLCLGLWDGNETTATEIIWERGIFTAAEIIEYGPDAIKAERPIREPAPCF